MTRTERSHSLRALVKDRSEARNGMDNSLRKDGAGAHNWGSIHTEYDHEIAGIADEVEEFEDQAAGAAGGKRLFLWRTVVALGWTWRKRRRRLSFIPAASQPSSEKPAVVRRTSSVTDEDRENAIKIRQNAFKSNRDGRMFFPRDSLSFILMTPFQRDRPRGHRSLFLRRLRLSHRGERYHVEHFGKSLCATPNDSVALDLTLLRRTLQ
jgi:hypothetical protein